VEESAVIFLVDWSWVCYLSFYGNQSLSVNKKGVEIKTGAIRGGFTFIKQIHEFCPEAIIYLCLDGKARKALRVLPEYKAQRERDNTIIGLNRDRLASVFVHMPFVKIAFHPDQEADDTIGFLCDSLPRCNGEEIVIMSTDMDLRQLVNNDLGISAAQRFDDSGLLKEKEKQVAFKMGCPPSGIPLLKAIMGDKSDNVPGIGGFKEEVAKKIASNFKTPDELMNARKGLLSGAYAVHMKRLFSCMETVRRNYVITKIDPEYIPTITETSDEDWRKFLKYYEAKTTLMQMEELCANRS